MIIILFLMSLALFEWDSFLSRYFSRDVFLTGIGLSSFLLSNPIIPIKDFNFSLGLEYTVYLLLANLIHFSNNYDRTIIVYN